MSQGTKKWRTMQVCVRLSLNSHVANEVIMNEDENGIERRGKQTANFKSSLRKEYHGTSVA